MNLRIIDVPDNFRPTTSIVHPPHQKNSLMIEEKAFDYFSKKNVESNLIYVPIFWTAYHINNNYGKKLEELKNFCSNLVKSYPNDRFFTIVQYDGGILVPFDNCQIFACSGNFNSPSGVNSNYIALPLLSDPHKFKAKKKNLLASFSGSFETHPIRKKMKNILSFEKGFKISKPSKYFNSYFYKKNMLSSIFALCPRGYGPASFRMYEALQMKLIPIYISDEFWLPFKEKIEWEKMCLLIVEDQIETIPLKVDQLIESGEYLNMIQYGQEVYQKYLNWDGCLNTIIDYIT